MPLGRETPMTFSDRLDQLQPLVLPQLGQAWQEPARIIWTPHCMHIGASLWRTRSTPAVGVWSLLGASGARPSSIEAARSPADGMLFGSAAMSDPVRVSIALSYTPGSVGCN